MKNGLKGDEGWNKENYLEVIAIERRWCWLGLGMCWKEENRLGQILGSRVRRKVFLEKEVCEKSEKPQSLDQRCFLWRWRRN